MEDDRQPISPDEYVLRRIHRNHAEEQFDPVRFQRLAFQPTQSDSEGLSVYRERFVSPHDVANSGRKPGEYYVVRLSAKELLENFGLNVRPDPQVGELPGHSLIPELNTATMKMTKKLQYDLAKLADGCIILTPDEKL